MKISLLNIASVGQINDQPGYQLPNEAWTLLSNIQIDDRQIKTVRGYEQFGTVDCIVVPQYCLAAADATRFRYIYPGIAKVYMTTTGSEAGHFETTPAPPPTSDATHRWNGCVLNGLPVLNNGKDTPIYMADLADATNFQVLPNWAATTAKVIRSYKNFLIALWVDTNPHHLAWSTSADTGSIPTTWTAATTNDAGDAYLADTNGALVDALSLGDNLVIYKDDSAYMVQYVKGLTIFRFSRIKSLPGMLSQDCGCEFEGGHFVVSDGDVYVTDGQSKKSVIDDRNKLRLFARMDEDNYDRTFVFHDREKKEIWICYPLTGTADDVGCNQALIWNYKDDVWTEKALPANTKFIVKGPISSSALTWETLKWVSWATWEGKWGTPRYSAVEDYPIAFTNDSKMYKIGSGNQAAGTNIPVTAERRSMRLQDNDSIYRVKAMYPLAQGDPFSVYMGTQMFPQDAITWEGPYTFTPGTDHKIDFRTTGRYHSVKFTSNANVAWRVHGYELDVEPAGSR